MPPGRLVQAVLSLRRGDVLLRLSLCAVAAVILWAVTNAWAPPFKWRTGYVPSRALAARVEFQVEDKAATDEAKQRARRQIVCVYRNDPRPLLELQQALVDQVFQIIAAESYEKLEPEVWSSFLLLPQEGEHTAEQRKEAFNRFRQTFANDESLNQLKQALEFAFTEFRQTGLLENLAHKLEDGSQSEISVYTSNPEERKRTPVGNVRIAEVVDDLNERLTSGLHLSQMMDNIGSAEVSARLFAWLRPRLPTTLTWDREETREVEERAVALVPPVMKVFAKGEPLLGVAGGEPLDEEDVALLRQEHRALTRALTFEERLIYSLSDFGMYIAMYVLCGFYMSFRAPNLIRDLRQFITLLGFVVVTVALIWAASGDQWRAELVPLLLFSMTLSIAYQQEMALLLAAAVAVVATLSLGQGLPEFVVLVASASASIVFLGRVRSRTKLVYVGFCAGVVAAFTALGVGAMGGQPLGLELVINAAWHGFCAILAGLLLTGLLPFIEWVFDIQTDISLLELGDNAHPVLQQLLRRAPGTYNHSNIVASIAEAAADSIGANGLLCRVAAYFHDIGKMLKPQYFIENQGEGDNRHESLAAAMSTLVIIAHVKDGAELARQHGLPRRIIDFIEQHHGTTLVEYFYRQAKGEKESNPDAAEVDESAFRYPGPKPQSREAAVMMLADAVESASRTLVDPTPARIESLVEKIGMARLLDGQFDECELTLKDLHQVQESLVKSLTAVYHGRVKYPSQQTA